MKSSLLSSLHLFVRCGLSMENTGKKKIAGRIAIEDTYCWSASHTHTSSPSCIVPYWTFEGGQQGKERSLPLEVMGMTGMQIKAMMQ